jgi:hypothetical protein
MNKFVAELNEAITRKRPSTTEWEFADHVGPYEIQATEYEIGARTAWLVKVGEQAYWSEDGKISAVDIADPSHFEKFGDSVDVNLQGWICEALRKFEQISPPQEPSITH